MKNIFIVILVVALAILSYMQFKPKEQVPPASVVPSDQTTTKNNQDSKDYQPNVSFDLPSQYIYAQNGWPPVIQSSDEKYSCSPSRTEVSNRVEKTINKRTYCVTLLQEGAAGSSFRTYTYSTFGIQGSSQKTSFTLRYPSCGVWQGDGTTKYTDCLTAQSNFTSSLDGIIGSLPWN